MNETRFLKLHDADDNSVIILAQTMITLCQAQQNGNGHKHTLIYINSEDILIQLLLMKLQRKFISFLRILKLSISS